MPSPDSYRSDIADTIAKVTDLFEVAIRRSNELHQAEADDGPVLAETALAVSTAKALECLTGIAWEDRLAYGDADHRPLS